MNIHVDMSSLAPPLDDCELLRLCRRATTLLIREEKIEARYMAALERYEAAKPERPQAPGSMEYWKIYERPSAAMRLHLKQMPGSPTRNAYRARIAVVVGYERACKALDRENGMSRLDVAAKRALVAVRAAIEPIVELKPTTLEGLAAKAGVLVMACDKNFTSADEPFDRLAWAIASDTMLIASPRFARPPRSDVGQPAHI